MLRDASIPLFLWIATAIVIHLVWGGGADRTASMLGQTRQIQSFAAAVQRSAAGRDKPMELAFISSPEELIDSTELTLPEPPKPKPPAEADKPAEVVKLEPPKPEPKKLEEKKEEKKKDEKKKPDEVKAIVVPEAQRRVAVQQHPTNEKDNPNARFIADKANRVEQETQARITSVDRDEPNPTPGKNSGGPHDTEGDSNRTKIAQSDDHDGEHRAPEKTEEKVARLERPATSRAQHPEEQTPQPGRAAQAALEARSEQPDVAPGSEGTWDAARAAQAQAAARAQSARRPVFPRRRPRSPWDLFGLDSDATTSNGIRLNINTADAIAVIGHDELVKEKQRDAERRRSQHRGSWKDGGLARWRSAIENYVPSVKPGNTTALNAAAVPFANYLHTIHNRLHPIFADTYLDSLDRLPSSSPLNRMDMSTNLEIVLSPEEGRIVRMGVTKTSGVTAFDVAALDSMSRAQPFGAPPKEIISPDGKVYLHWEFYRNPIYACSTYFARPFMLKAQPGTAPPTVAPPSSPPSDGTPERDRHGELPSDRSRMHASR